MRNDFRSNVLNFVEPELCTLSNENGDDASLLSVLTSDLLEELDEFGWHNIMEVSEDLSILQLSVSLGDILNVTPGMTGTQFADDRKINLILATQPLGLHAYCADLPITFSSTTTRSLNQALETLASFVLPFVPTWQLLNDIDSYFVVLEPDEMQLKYFYRKIWMKNSTFVTLTFDPAEPQSIPLISLDGIAGNATSLKQTLNRNWGLWSFDNNVLTNLCNILEVSEEMFTRDGPNLEKSYEQSGYDLFEDFENEQDDGIFEQVASGPIEPCKICLSVSLVSSGNAGAEDYAVKFDASASSPTPDVFCSQQTCSGRFHESCVKDWFRSCTEAKPVFGSIYGPCPVCKTAMISIES